MLARLWRAFNFFLSAISVSSVFSVVQILATSRLLFTFLSHPVETRRAPPEGRGSLREGSERAYCVFFLSGAGLSAGGGAAASLGHSTL